MQLAPSTLAQWAGAIATSAAVVVALFKEEISRVFRRPKLVVRIQPIAPDCVKTPIHVTAGGNLQWAGEAYFLRLWIENSGALRAEKVQVFLADVKRLQSDGSFGTVPGFLPMNLRWSHTDFFKPEVYADGISPKMGKHCDLACISDPHNPTLPPLPDSPQGKTTVDLWLEVFPATQSHRLPTGTYVLEVRVAAANSWPANFRIQLNNNGEWFTNEAKMFARGVGVKQLG